MLKPLWIACLFAGVAGTAAPAAVAQDEAGLVRLVVPYAPGGFPDTIARLVAGQLSQDTRLRIVIENRPGGAGAIAAQYVAKSAPDGNTLLVGDAQQWAISPAMLKNFGSTVEHDFAPVTLLGVSGNYLVVNSTLGVSDFGALVAMINASPGKYNYGTPGVGSIHHLTLEVMASRLGLKMTHIPFRGGSEFIAALLAGTVDLGVQALPTVRALARDGKLKILAVASAKRSKLAPDLPTMEEFGVRDMDFPGAIGILAPKATPPDVVAQRAKAMNTAVTGPAVVEKLATYAIEPTALTPQEFGDWIARDIVKFRDAVASAGLMPQ